MAGLSVNALPALSPHLAQALSLWATWQEVHNSYADRNQERGHFPETQPRQSCQEVGEEALHGTTAMHSTGTPCSIKTLSIINSENSRAENVCTNHFVHYLFYCEEDPGKGGSFPRNIGKSRTGANFLILHSQEENIERFTLSSEEAQASWAGLARPI